MTSLQITSKNPPQFRKGFILLLLGFALGHLGFGKSLDYENHIAQVPDIQNVYFDFNKSDLRQESKEDLAKIVRYLSDNLDVKLEVIGHADYYGSYEYNLKLTKRRCATIAQYLIASGIPESRIQQTWLSENRPIETNANDAGRQYNRRAEFKFYSGSGLFIFQSQKLRPEISEIYVDHQKPKTKGGYDKPDPGFSYSFTAPGAASGSSLNTPKSNPSPVLIDLQNLSSSVASGPWSNTKQAKSSTYDSDWPKGISIRHLYFDFDKTYLRSNFQQSLVKIASLMQSNPDLKLEIRGHTDSFGSLNYNKAIGENRANSVFLALTKLRVDPDRMKIVSYGELQPISTNQTEKGRQENRRVEFIFKQGAQEVYNSIP